MVMPGKDRPILTIPELTQSEIIHFRKLKMITNLLDPKKVNHTPATGKARMSSEIYHKQNCQDTTRI